MMSTLFRKKTRRRRGSVHVIVMGVAMIVAVMAAGGLIVRRIERRLAANSADRASARLFALAAIEEGRVWVQHDADWRTRFSNGTWFSGQGIGTGSCDLLGVDPVDGDLTNNWLDPLELTGVGTAGNARQQLRVTLQPRIVGVDALQVAAIGSTLSFSRARLTCDQTVASNGWVFASHSSVRSDVEAVTEVWGGNYLGGVARDVEARRMPDPVALFDYYTARGTAISWSDLTTVGAGDRVLERVLLSPTSNPFGAGKTNSEGIYVIDCGGHDLRVTNCRIMGTLVVRNAGPRTEFSNNVNSSAAVANYPTLLVDGPLWLELRADEPLKEQGNPNVNFNPVGSPYNGLTDDDETDDYPTEIRGLVYASGKVKLHKSSRILGVLLAGGALEVSGTPELIYSSSFLDDPPVGFQMTVLDPVPGSWRQVTD